MPRILSTLSALVLLAGTAAARAPVKPPRDTAAKHIKIVKEPSKDTVKSAGGEVALPRCAVMPACDMTIPAAHDDSVRIAQYRLDSIAAARNDEAREARLRADEAARLDAARRDSIATANAARLALARSIARGWYFGIAGGASAPQRDLRNGYTGGWNVTIPIGYDATDNPLGVRLDGAVDHLNGTRVHNASEVTVAMSGDVTVWSLNLDGKLRIPAPGGAARSHLYLLGGVGGHVVTGGVYGTSGPLAGQNIPYDSTRSRFGWNVGAGASMKWGGAELFIESRFFQIKTDYAFHSTGGIGTYASFTPVVVGLNWF